MSAGPGVAGAEPVIAVIALGSNLGDREATLERAVAALDGLPESSIHAVSPWHGTVALTPEGLDPEKPQYLNGVALLQTSLDPAALLAALHRIEHDNGRERVEQWGDRTLDLDIVAYGDLVLVTPDLTVPHPRAHERDFVLAPWLDVQPDAELAGHGPVSELLSALREGSAS